MKNNKDNDNSYMPKQWVGCDVEAEYMGEERKQSKEDRKRLSKRDRSKYKKTDQKMLKKAENSSDDSLPTGRVLSIKSQEIIVEHEGKIYRCMLRGILKKERNNMKNLVTVGDMVRFEPLNENEGAITFVNPRKSVLSRADNLSRRKEHLIAANIDQVLITASLVNPPLKPFLIDRYIIATQKGNMNPVLIVNKVDLLENNEDPFVLEEKELYEEFLKAYAKSGFPIISISAETGEGLEALRDIMKDKSSVFSGQSGVGKSSLINKITGLDLTVGETVSHTKKGAHTTTSAQLIPLSFGGWCIDTPGIKSFGLWNLTPEEVEPYFDEIIEAGHHCKFPDCSHRHEKECAVIAAVEEGTISIIRYASYIALLDTLAEEHKRR